MRNKYIGMSMLAGLVMVSPVVRAATYDLDASHTTVGFGVRHMVVTTVHGKFNEFKGSLEVSEAGAIEKVSATITAGSVDTDNADRDKHLRSPDFFDAEKFPSLTFESKKVEKSGEAYNVTGDLTIRGVTKEITLPLTLSGPITDPWGNVRVGVEGQTKINRKDYGLVWNKTLDGGGLVVGDEVTINISAEAIQKK